MTRGSWASRLDEAIALWQRGASADSASSCRVSPGELRALASCPRMAVAEHLARADEPFSWRVPIAAASLAERALRQAFDSLRPEVADATRRSGRFAVALRRAVREGVEPSESLGEWLADAGGVLRSMTEARAVSIALGWWLAIERSGVPLAQAASGARTLAQACGGRARLVSQPLLRSFGDQHWGPKSFRVVVSTRDRPPGSAERLGGLVALVEGASTGERLPSVVWVVQPEEGWADAVPVTSRRLEEAVADLGAFLGALLEGGARLGALRARPSGLCRWCRCRQACPEAAEVSWQSHAEVPPVVAAWLGAEVGNLSTSVDYGSPGE